ncbi:hypothetical protein GUJ93_ZPchr0656g26853 [Zizania palustris]|uniref:Uncharacterized protein n=1 Tax=Zizania palustris TaxID=103762 RepID=A0A8J5RHK3_ZIZPA|nr:hypothetical protein GUJ93_ZPchr0656g26853 [Zizania palustris]
MQIQIPSEGREQQAVFRLTAEGQRTSLTLMLPVDAGVTLAAVLASAATMPRRSGRHGIWDAAARHCTLARAKMLLQPMPSIPDRNMQKYSTNRSSNLNAGQATAAGPVATRSHERNQATRSRSSRWARAGHARRVRPPAGHARAATRRLRSRPHPATRGGHARAQQAAAGHARADHARAATAGATRSAAGGHAQQAAGTARAAGGDSVLRAAGGGIRSGYQLLPYAIQQVSGHRFTGSHPKRNLAVDDFPLKTTRLAS